MKSTNPIADLFGRSPFKPTQEHMRLVQGCLSMIPPLIEALIGDDRAAVEKIQRDLREQAARARRLRKDIRLHLPRSLFMPIDRREIFDLLDLQDDIAGGARDIAARLVERPLPIPPALGSDLRALARYDEESCRQAMRVIDELDELIETGFRGPEAERVERMIEELDRLEGQADERRLALGRALFALEDSLDPVTLVRLSRCVEELGTLASQSARIGDRLLPLIAR